LKHIGLFEGIGGFSIAVKLMGWETVAWCEWNEFGQKVLRHHFPEAEGFGDIKKTDFKKYANTIDILTGGFPCQPYSTAGKRLGKEDERHLWPEMLRAIREIQPGWVVGENVSGLTNWNGGMVFDEVQADLENEGYKVLPFLLPACAVNAPHRRDRIWFIAYNDKCAKRPPGKSRETFSNGSKNNDEQESWGEQAKQYIGCGSFLQNATNSCTGIQGEAFGGRNEEKAQHGNSGYGSKRIIADTDAARQWWNEWESKGKGNLWEQFPTQSPLCGGDDGIPTQLDGITFSKWRNESLKAYGNAIVPQVALQILKAIAQMSDEMLNTERNVWQGKKNRN